MRTPAGKECRYYYEDFHRGREIQECRSIKYNPESAPWHPGDCSRCPVPDILLANADPDMELIVTVRKGLFGLTRNLDVTARSRSDGTIIEDPYVGRTDKDNPGLDIFRKALDNDDD